MQLQINKKILAMKGLEPQKPLFNCKNVVMLPSIKMSSNKSSFLQYLHLFWPVQQLRAVVEPNLSLPQNALIS
jgi:hypothetical protein